jgi:Pre-mRNA-splicing factor SF3A3, of SF3a complex, Prp9
MVPHIIVLFASFTHSALRFLQEAFGRYLDMHELYNEFINSKFGTPIEYSVYVGTFSETGKIPRNLKSK